MSQLTFDKNGIVFHDDANRSQRLLNHLNAADNQSDLPQAELVRHVQDSLQQIFDGTLDGMTRLIIFLRIVARLLRKPQTHHVLHVGSWSPIDEVLAKTLPLFDVRNALWHYAPTRPVGKFPNVNFIFAEVNGAELYLPTETFDTILFDAQRVPPPEVLLAPKDFGTIYFSLPRTLLPDFLATPAQMFDVAKNLSAVELEISPPLRRELRLRTPQGQLDAKKAFIRQTVYKMQEVGKRFNTLPPPERVACLDEYIADLTRAEKVLNEIFPQLHSDTIKLNFNMFKEFFIDMRLYDDWGLKTRAVEDLNRQTQILLRDLNDL